MIDKQEVLEFASLMNLLPHTVEKDYVLGWVLAGIEQNTDIFSAWCFKGGTCLKKCYFETYRFSEDLDFTISAPAQLNNDFLVGAFSEIGQWIYENSGIELPEDSISFDIYQTANGKLAAQGKIGYIGPLRRRHSIPKLKFDLTTDELIVLEPVVTEVHHSYSDKPESGIHARCYPYEEVFAEKIRALAQRARPRDLYDVIFLFRNQHLVYKNKRRTIEPYSFRMSSEGAKLFYGYEKEAGHPKCYRLDRFGSVSVTNIPFTPRYRIEISSYGPVRMPPVSSIARKASSKSGPVYIYKCYRCERTFRRTKRDAKMQPHKDKNGYKCSGRRGYLEETIY